MRESGRKNVVLIGMMGCGKSTCGALLAQKLGRKLVDTDLEIEREAGCTISAIFAEKGEAAFRKMEQETAEKLARRISLVIACGGGLPLREESIRPLKESGTVIFLRRDPGETYDGLDVSGRPLAQGGREAFLDRFREREPVYRKWADEVVTDFSSPMRTVEAILEVLK